MFWPHWFQRHPISAVPQAMVGRAKWLPRTGNDRLGVVEAVGEPVQRITRQGDFEAVPALLTLSLEGKPGA